MKGKWVVSTSIIVFPDDLDDAISIHSSLSKRYPSIQRIFVFSDKTSCEWMNLIYEDESIFDWGDGSEEMISKAIRHSNGDYIAVIDGGERLSDGFIDSMNLIQRNVGADVIVSDCLEAPSPKSKLEVFHSPELLMSRYSTIESQWIKFFRRSLLDDDAIKSISELAQKITKVAKSVCYYHEMTFSSEHIHWMSDSKYSIGCRWALDYHSLNNPDELSDAEKKHITIGICAYNEQYVIERTVRSIFTQHDGSYVIDKIIIVSSGSTDDTDKIIDRMSKEINLIHPIYQQKREGKNSAVNEILRNSDSEIIVLYNADNVFASEYTLDMLIRPFLSDDVGMTGGHPVPINASSSISDYTVQLMWAVHHNVSMQSPNMGELIAFRNIGVELPTDMQGDEAIIRYHIEKKGLKIVYVPTATIINKGPTTVKEFIKQRQRVNIGEANMAQRYALKHSTHSSNFLSKALWRSLVDIGYDPLKTPLAVFLEYYSRMKARLYVKGNTDDISVWEQIGTTKKL